LATSKPRPFAERILEHFQLRDFFEMAFGSELNGLLTDKPSLVRHILDTTRLQPPQTMIIGDRKYDLLGGRANDIWTGAVTYGYGTEQELRQTGADVFFHSPAHISEVLLGRFQPPPM
jgi:phosphoglycolate phosphatase